MKSFFLATAAFIALSLYQAAPAFAFATEHDSAYANTDGSSRFTDPDDQATGAQFGTVQLFGSNSADRDSNGVVTFGFSASNGQSNALPDFSLTAPANEPTK